MKLLEFKIWGGHREENDAIYVWSSCMDDAIYIARWIDPDVCVVQWTGRKEDKE